MIKKYLHQETLIYWLMTCKKLWNAICCVNFPKSMIKCHSKILDLHLSPCKKIEKKKVLFILLWEYHDFMIENPRFVFMMKNYELYF